MAINLQGKGGQGDRLKTIIIRLAGLCTLRLRPELGLEHRKGSTGFLEKGSGCQPFREIANPFTHGHCLRELVTETYIFKPEHHQCPLRNREVGNFTQNGLPRRFSGWARWGRGPAKSSSLQVHIWGRRRKDTLQLLQLLLLLSPNSLGKKCGTSWGTGEAAPQGASWHLQVKANKPVEHIEEEESDRENNSRVVIQAVDMDEEAALLPAATITTRDHAAIPPAPPAAAARARGSAWPHSLAGWARWSLVLFITLLLLFLLRVLNVAHERFRIWDAGRGGGTHMDTRMAKFWRTTGVRPVVGQEVEHGKLH